MKKIVFVLSMIMSLASLPALAAQKTYVNGIDANYPPFAYIDEKTGSPAGFDVESMNFIAKKMGFEVKHVPVAWDGIIPALLAKKIDMICSGMSATDARKTQVGFSDPYWTVDRVFVVKKGSVLKADELFTAKIKIGAQRGTNESTELQKEKEARKSPMEIRLYDSAPLAIEDLMNGRIDAALMDELPAADAAAAGKTIVKIGTFGHPSPFGVAVRKNDAELLKLINEGYKQLMADPFWQELQKKYTTKLPQ